MKKLRIFEHLTLVSIGVLSFGGFMHIKEELKEIERMVSFASVHYNIGDALGWGAAEAKFKRHIEESNVVCIAFGRGEFGSFKIDNQTEWPLMIVAATNHATVLTNPISFRMNTNPALNGPLYISGFYIDAREWTNAALTILAIE